MARSESLKRAQEKYQSKCKNYAMRLRLDKDADIIEWLNSTNNPSSQIKDMIRLQITLGNKSVK